MQMLSYHPPLKERIIGKDLHTEKPSGHVEADRPLKYKSWKSEHMVTAIAAVQSKKCTVREASEIYGVPKSTLHDRISGKVIHGSCSGPERYLTDTEENSLVKFLYKCSSIGFARSKKQVIALVNEIMQKKGKVITVSSGWWESFRKRHPDLVLRTAEPLSYARAVCTSDDILDAYYDMLEATLTDNGLIGKPMQVFNMDETGMPLDPTPASVIAPVGSRHVSCMRSGDKTNITVVACCNASGSVIPPLVIFDRKFLKPEYTYGEVPGTAYALSGSGWITAKIFDDWFHNHFLCYAPGVRPILLLLDGHSSHYNPSVIESAAEEGVIIFCLPPNTTHRTQPLDKGCFAPLKSYWKEECQNYLSKHKGKAITRFQFSEVFSRAWVRGMTMGNVIAGFRTTGIFPLDRSAVKSKALVDPAEAFDPCGLPKETGIKFLPLYSPLVGSRQKERHEKKMVSQHKEPCEDEDIRKDDTYDREHKKRPGLGSRQKERHEEKMTSQCQESFECNYADNGKDIACGQEYKKGSQLGEQGLDFTDAEITLYERRYQEGYDLHDERYSEWVQKFHPENNKGSKPGEQCLDFTSAEINLYERRYQEGYDLNHDERYNEWIQKFHPFGFVRPSSFSTPDQSLRESDTADDDWSRIVQGSFSADSDDSTDIRCLEKVSLVSKLLDQRKEDFKLPNIKKKKSSCVLTSEENLKLLKEKEMKKKKEEEEKAQRRELRQKKKREEEEKMQHRQERKKKDSQQNKST